jgi:ATP dependent DNA ligase domain
MPKDLFCLPTGREVVPAGPDWIHEVKYDGYRLRVERNRDRVRLLSKNGLDWTKRYPWIVETARKIRKKQFILDGEAVVLGVDGISNFNDLHSRQYDEEVQLVADQGAAMLSFTFQLPSRSKPDLAGSILTSVIDAPHLVHGESTASVLGNNERVLRGLGTVTPCEAGALPNSLSPITTKCWKAAIDGR